VLVPGVPANVSFTHERRPAYAQISRLDDGAAAGVYLRTTYPHCLVIG